MNNAEVVAKVAAKSGVSEAECQLVLDAFKEVLSDELMSSNGIGNAFDKFYNVMSFFKGKKG